MLIYDGKEFRNLEEQVRKNKDDISYLKKIQTLLNQFGIHVIGKVDDASQLPGTSDTFGNAFAVGLAAPYEYYIWTDLEPTPGWMNIGIFPAPSTVEGPIGPRGTSVTAATVTDTGYLVLTLTDADNNETQVTVGYIKGPQGATGPRGIQGVKGDTGEQGPRGYTGEQGPRGYSGFALDIIAILSEEAELPDPSTAGRHDAYVIEDSGNYELFGLVESSGLTPYEWASFGYIAFSTNYVTASQLSAALAALEGRSIGNIGVYTNELRFYNLNGSLNDTINFAKINGDPIVGVNTNFSLATKVELQSAIDALILGTTVVAKSKATESIEPQNENAGVTQETPFICQGTATANNTTSTSVSPIAKQLEKQGNTVVVNQLNSIPSGTISSSVTNARAANVIGGHKYLLIQKLSRASNGTSTDYQTLLRFNNTTIEYGYNTKPFEIRNITSSGILRFGYAIYGSFASNVDFEWYVVDITKWEFDATTLTYLTSHPEAFKNYYNGSLAYNIGQLVSSDGQYLVTIGFNQLNPATSDNYQYIGHYYINENTYLLSADNDYNYYRIRVIPNTNYCISKTKNETLGSVGIIRFVDENYELISGNDNGYSATQKYVVETPDNCVYMEISLPISADFKVCVNLSWDTERDGEYEDFVKHVYDTGNEPLEEWDTKVSNGTIYRNGANIDLSTLNWTSQTFGSANVWVADLLSNMESYADDEEPNLRCDKYMGLTVDDIYNNVLGIAIRSTNSKIYVNNGSTTTEPTGTLRYKLVTATTEQGTPLANIIDVEDYSVMYWLNSSNNFVSIPQGCKIFYEPDYVGLIDDLGNYTNYDVTVLAKKSDLLPKLPDSSNDGTYVLKATKSGSTITYTWEQE